jgi:hypothetical protein
VEVSRVIQSLTSHFRLFLSGIHPTVSQVIRSLTQGAANVEATVKKYADAVYQIAGVPHQYFLEKTATNPSLSIFKAAVIFDPSQINLPDVDVLKCIDAIPIVNKSPLLYELAIYQTLALETKEMAPDVWKWWQDHQRALPHWSAAAKRMALIQPSSASVERVFSILENVTSGSQSRLLEDALEATILLRYNSRS